MSGPGPVFVRHLVWTGVLLLFIVFSRSEALEVLPYATRTRSYDGVRLSAQGNLRSLGMAGESVGLGTSYYSSVANPAGLAMTLDGANLDLSSSTVHDGAIQDFAAPLKPFSFGLTFAPYPWGFGFAYRERPLEDQVYATFNQPWVPLSLNVTTHDFNFSASHVLYDDQLSLGASLIVGQGVERIRSGVGGQSQVERQALAVGTAVGLMWQLPHRLLLGVGVTSPLHYGFDSTTQSPSFPGFFQSIEVPMRVGVGLGWKPNRFVRADATVFLMGTNDGVALLRDEESQIGKSVTLQPKAGVSYQFLDYKELQVTLNVGAYLEVSRIEFYPNRVHATSSLEVLPWVFILGFGIDSSDSYRNTILSFGVNVIKAMELLEFIPKITQSVRRGALPDPITPFDAGISRSLHTDPK